MKTFVYILTFVQSLKQKEIEHITITSLCETIDINRTTFYLHYNDIYALLEDVENDFFFQLETFVDQLIKANIASTDITKAVLSFIKENKELLHLFLIKRKDLFLSSC